MAPVFAIVVIKAQAAHEAMTTGRRYSGTEALAARIIDHVAPEDGVQAKAIEIASMPATPTEHDTL